MSAQPQTKISEEEYLQMERNAFEKSEYYKGEVFAMAGATKEHNKIVASLIITLGGFVSGRGCSVFPSDLRVYNPQNTLYTYPDLTIVCGKEEYLDNQFDTLTNPTVIVEVLSEKTELYDRGSKFRLYRSIPSLQNYVLIGSTEVLTEVYTRQGDEWIFTAASSREESIYISAINYNLKLDDVYAQLEDFTGDSIQR